MKDLISVIIHAYNSSKTILDTLESIKRQTYPRIELIISDDSSTDDTVLIASQWLKINETCFEASRVVPHAENMGIAKHLVESVKIAKGRWIKTIAGDDMLGDNCLNKFAVFVRHHPMAEFVISDMYLFNGEEVWNMPSWERAYSRFLCSKNAQTQYRLLLKQDLYESPSEFFRTDIFIKYGEPINPARDIEDWPLRLHLTKNGCKIYYLNCKTVYYRQGISSISRIQGAYFNPRHLNNSKLIDKELIYPNISPLDITFWWNEFLKYIRYVLILSLGNRQGTSTSIINNIIMLLQPKSYKKLIWEIIGRIYDRSH